MSKRYVASLFVSRHISVVDRVSGRAVCPAVRKPAVIFHDLAGQSAAQLAALSIFFLQSFLLCVQLRRQPFARRPFPKAGVTEVRIVEGGTGKREVVGGCFHIFSQRPWSDGRYAVQHIFLCVLESGLRILSEVAFPGHHPLSSVSGFSPLLP